MVHVVIDIGILAGVGQVVCVCVTRAVLMIMMTSVHVGHFKFSSVQSLQ